MAAESAQAGNWNRNLLYVAGLVLLSIVPRVYYATPYLWDGDPVSYYLGAVNLITGQGYTAMGAPVIWPIGYSLTIVPFLLIWESPMAAVASSILFSTSAVVLLYFIGARLFGRGAGFIAGLMLGLSEAYFFNSVNVASDTHPVLFSLAALYIYLGYRDKPDLRRIFAVGLLIGLAVLMRYGAVTFLLFPILVYWWERLRGMGAVEPGGVKVALKAVTALAAGFALPLLVQVYVDLLSWGTLLPERYAAATSSGFDTAVLKYALNFFRMLYRTFFTVDMYMPVGAALLLIGGAQAYRNTRHLPLLLIFALCGALPMFGYLVLPRYFLPVVPAMFLLMGEGAVKLFGWMDESLSSTGMLRGARLAVIGLVAIVLTTPYAASAFRRAEFNREESRMAAEAFTWVKENTRRDSAVITQSPYYGHFSIYEAIGQDIWSGKYYCEREMYAVFDDPQKILADHLEVYVVINEYWQAAENLRMMYAGKNRESVNLLFAGYSMEETAVFPSETSFTLRKLLADDFHPDTYFTPPIRFVVYRLRGKDG